MYNNVKKQSGTMTTKRRDNAGQCGMSKTGQRDNYSEYCPVHCPAPYSLCFNEFSDLWDNGTIKHLNMTKIRIRGNTQCLTHLIARPLAREGLSHCPMCFLPD